MTSSALEQFMADAAALARSHPEPADCVALCDVAAGTRRNVDLAHNES